MYLVEASELLYSGTNIIENNISHGHPFNFITILKLSMAGHYDTTAKVAFLVRLQPLSLCFLLGE